MAFTACTEPCVCCSCCFCSLWREQFQLLYGHGLSQLQGSAALVMVMASTGGLVRSAYQPQHSHQMPCSQVPVLCCVPATYAQLMQAKALLCICMLIATSISKMASCVFILKHMSLAFLACRCTLCSGTGAVGWEGKWNHKEPCPMCLGKRFVDCPECGGHFHRRIFNHHHHKGLTVTELVEAEQGTFAKMGD